METQRQVLNVKNILYLLFKIAQSYFINGHLFSVHNLKKTNIGTSAI